MCHVLEDGIILWPHATISADSLKSIVLLVQCSYCNDWYCSPEGSATSPISGPNPAATQQCSGPDQSTNTMGTPKPPPGYGDDPCSGGNLAESFSSNQRTTSTASVVGKWPLKPGVLVHSKQQLLKSPQPTGGQYQPNDAVDNRSGRPADKVGANSTNDKFKSKKSNNNCKAKSSAADNVVLTTETQSARAARIRRMMIGSTNDLSKKSAPMTPPPAPPVRKPPDYSTRNVGEKNLSTVTGRTKQTINDRVYYFYL